MNILQLKYFQKVAACGSLSLAAKELMVSTPSLCSTIKRLERDLGYTLFEKVGRNIHLNQNGHILLRHADDILASLQAAEAELDASKAGAARTLRLGVTSQTLWTAVINRFLLDHPGTEILCETLDYQDIASPALHQSYDLILSSTTDFSLPDWAEAPLVTEDSPMLIVYKEHPFAQRTEVALEEARDEPFIALKKDTFARYYFNVLFQKAGFAPNVVISCDYVLRSPLIRSRYGLGITTRLGSKTELLSDLVCIDITAPKLHRCQSVFHYMDTPLTDLGREFQRYAADYFSKNL